MSRRWCQWLLQWLVKLNSGLRPKLSHLVSVFGPSERLIEKVKWPIVLDWIRNWGTVYRHKWPSGDTSTLCTFSGLALCCHLVNAFAMCFLWVFSQQYNNPLSALLLLTGWEGHFIRETIHSLPPLCDIWDVMSGWMKVNINGTVSVLQYCVLL